MDPDEDCVSHSTSQIAAALLLGGQVVLAEFVSPISLSPQILDIVVVNANDMFDPFDMRHAQRSQVFLLFWVISQ
jgi:hypothetical protein